MISDSFKQDLLNRIDIVDLIERSVPLKKAGANYSACCPFHTEKTPSFTVSPTKQFYHCFGCGANGNAITFLMEYQGMEFVDAVRDLAQMAGMKMPEFEPRGPAKDPDAPDLFEVMEKATQYYRDQLKSAPQAIDYLKGRGLTGRIALRFGIGYAPEGWQNLQAVFPDYAGKPLKDVGLVIDNEAGRRYDRFRDRIMFPILNQRGSVIGFGGRVLGEGEPKYLNSPETSLFEKGQELYGLSQARNAIRVKGRALVVEGYMDVVALAQHGVEYAVATLGTATTATHIQKLFRQTDEVVFCFDGDTAGRKAAWHALEISLPLLADAKVLRFLFLPAEDDPDTYVRAYGAQAFETKVAEARPLSEFLLSELQTRVDMKTLEGRSKLIAQAKPLLLKVAAPALRIQLSKQLAELTGMSDEEIGNLTGIRATHNAGGIKKSFSAPAKRAMADGTIENLLLRGVLALPHLALEIPGELVDSRQAAGRALVALVDYVTEHPDTSSVVAIDHFAGTEYEKILLQSRLQSMEMQIEGQDIEVEFRHALQSLQVRELDGRIKVLAANIQEGKATEEERLEYSSLIKEQAALRRPPEERPKVL